MRKPYNYIVPIGVCIVVAALLFCGYYRYETDPLIVRPVYVPVVVLLCFAIGYVGEWIAARFGRYNIAVGVAIMRHIAVFVGVLVAFGSTTRIVAASAIAFLIPFWGLILCLVTLATRWMFFALIGVLWIGAILETVLLSIERASRHKLVAMPHDGEKTMPADV